MWISGGPFVERFEREFAAFSGVRHALTAANGTAALHLAYLGIGIRQGDEVIVPGFAFMGAANVALHMGAKPVFADVDPTTWCITAAEIAKRLSPSTKVIMAVHTYGNVCEMDEIIQLARSRKVMVIEDAAESFACRYRSRLAGTIAPVGIYSFHATKTITTGEGGMVVTDDDAIADRVGLYRSHGMRRKRFYWHDVPGHNFRLTNLQAALGVAQLEQVKPIVRERRRVHQVYKRLLSGLPGVTLQQFPTSVDAVLWAIAMTLDPGAYPQGRDAVIQQMRESGIETRPGFVAARSMPHIYESPELPTAERLSDQVLSLPTFPTLTDENIATICAALGALRR
jgi:perosamine synthetase